MSVLIIVFLTAVSVLFTGVFNQGKFARYVGILGLGIALAVSYGSDCDFFAKYKPMFYFNGVAALYTKMVLAITLLIFFLGSFAFSNHRSHQSELYALILFSLCGGIILFGFQNLVTLFLGIEILSIPLYVIAGSTKTNIRSVEASMKYFLMGAFATGFLLFGIALVYGGAGSFDLGAIHNFSITNGKDTVFLLGVILMLVAMAFKVSLAPFHMWSPDVYQGAPSLITSFMASVVKIAGFAAFFKMMTMGFGGSFSGWIDIIAALVVITLILSNLMGLAQTNAKRMLAYSSVSHAGYIALIFFGYNVASYYYMAFYLFAYSLATIGVFMNLIWVEKIKKETSFDAFCGLAKTEPLLALVSAVSLLSMAGIPLTAGFIGKFNIFSQAISGGALLVVIVAIVGSALSIAYYLRLIIAMFFYKETTFKTSESASITYKIVAVFVILLLIALGVYPDLFAYQFGLN
ncbi:NADH-quinone oxidoreductase subunit N [Riemerella columbipharyngis]|uniref:NADH-quinone oxidoreductase subunit N n=1 Tax=Riemerella columbipharyngis TaxID=1071918 RepID=A0A1G7BSJ3_9FLAO|nr:NADH-quinone oxidoreductase subunit N [Riemerella columbipharyngis]SDE29610.1 NADH-quinone oxidoreductase subunit N [Riemerella columbipharyngis]